MNGSEFAYLRHRAGFDQQAAAQFLDVSLRTVQRYERRGAPRMAVLALAVRAGLYPSWEGFWLRDDRFTNPHGDSLSRAELEDWRYQLYLAWWRGWEAHRKQTTAPAASEPSPRRLYLINGGRSNDH